MSADSNGGHLGDRRGGNRRTARFFRINGLAGCCKNGYELNLKWHILQKNPQ